MSARELLASGAGIILIDEQIITVSGNWTKVAGVKPTDKVIVDIWGGGGSGARGNYNYLGGGQGGAHLRLEFFAYELPSSVTCYIGAGGAALSTDSQGLDGGDSIFGGIAVPGGKGGQQLGSAGGFFHDRTKTRIFTQGLSVFNDAANTPAAQTFPDPRLLIELGATSLSGDPLVGTKFAAGGGGGNTNSGSSVNAGLSLLGGAGGAAAPGPGNALSGQVPGGGGGGKNSSQSGTSGAGARGEIRVRVLRGAS